MTIVGNILVLMGSLFLFLGSLGIFRMPDVYNRLQAGTKATTLGAMSLILGVGFLDSGFLIKSIAIILFIVLTNPISSSTIARASHKSGIPLTIKSVIDVCQDDIKREEV